jgi:hypothetical protein
MREKKDETKMTTSNTSPKRTPPTPEQATAERKRQEEKATPAGKTALADNPITTLPAIAKSTALATPDARTAIQKWQDDNAPATIVGRLIKFSKGAYTIRDDDTVISDDIDFTALVDQMAIGWVKYDDGSIDRVMGLPYDGFVQPPRETLGDTDPSEWEIGLDGKPADKWQNTAYVALQRVDTGEMFTFATSSDTGRRAVGNLTRHYDRLQKTHPDMYPVIRLKVGGFNHRDERVGWVATPVFVLLSGAHQRTARPSQTHRLLLT